MILGPSKFSFMHTFGNYSHIKLCWYRKISSSLETVRWWFACRLYWNEHSNRFHRLPFWHSVNKSKVIACFGKKLCSHEQAVEHFVSICAMKTFVWSFRVTRFKFEPNSFRHNAFDLSQFIFRKWTISCIINLNDPLWEMCLIKIGEFVILQVTWELRQEEPILRKTDSQIAWFRLKVTLCTPTKTLITLRHYWKIYFAHYYLARRELRHVTFDVQIGQFWFLNFTFLPRLDFFAKE